MKQAHFKILALGECDTPGIPHEIIFLISLLTKIVSQDLNRRFIQTA
jgi:hypothetical protein